MQKPTGKQLKVTCQYLKGENLMRIHACHCADLKSKFALSNVVNIKEEGVGLSLQYH